MLKADGPPLENVLRQQESLRTVIELISNDLELPSLLSRIIYSACELLGATRGAIGLVDSNRPIMRIEAVYNMPEGELGSELKPGEGLAGQVWQTRQPVFLKHYGDLPSPLYQDDMRNDTVIGIPIIWRDQMIGFFGIGAPPPHRFAKWHVETLTLFARHAAIAIVNAQLFAEAQKTLKETRLLYETSRYISTSMDVDEVVLAYLKQVAARGRYKCSVALYEFNEKGERVSVRVRGRWSPENGFEYPEEIHPYSLDTLDELLDSGETVLIEDVFADSRVPDGLRDIQRQANRPALAMIPLLVRNNRIGLVILSYPEVHEWNEEELNSYRLTASQLEMAIDSRQQHQLLVNRSRQLTILEERRRLACELHDSVTHLLFSITLIAQSIAPAWRRSTDEGEERIKRLLELTQMTMAEMRALLTELRPSETDLPFETESFRPSVDRLRRFGLVGALTKHIADVAKDGLAIDIYSEGYVGQTLEIEEALYRIAQEALNNVLKHAQATHVQITVSLTNAIITLTIADNGTGFSPDTIASTFPDASPQSHLGLKTMRERAEALNGHVQVMTTPGYGTKVEATIPID